MRKRNLLLILSIFCFSIQLIAADECKISACTYSNRSSYKIKFPDNVFIMIDPGHGGDAYPNIGCDSNGNSPLVDERDLVREIAKIVVDRLHVYGLYHIRATRSLLVDQTNDITDKVETINDFFGSSKNLYDSICKDICCDPFVPILLSLHCNGGPASAKGAEQYRYYENDLPGLVQEVLDQIEESNRAEKIKNGTGLILLNQTIPILQTKYGFYPYHTYCELGFIWNTNNYNVLTKRKKEVGKRIADRIMLLALNKGYRFSKDTEVSCRKSDNADDNYSIATVSGNGFDINLDSKVVVPLDLLTNDILTLLTKSGEPPAIFAGGFSSDLWKNHPIIIIPSGILAEKENDSAFKIHLEQYVKNGGTVIVLAQQYGTHYEKVVPLPEGSSLSALGWREDQSCFWGSAYHKTLNNVPHPIFSGVGGESVNVGVDGYFSIIPTEATVLLRRKLNQEPVMISYPYGEGTVILTSLFSDFANAHSQMSGVDEAHIIRDLLTYARNVKRDIPSWRLTNNQAMAISLPEVDVRNDGEVSAARAKFRVLSPDRKRVLYTVEQSISIDPQTSGGVALEFSITPTGSYDNIVRQWLGIYHVEVELYDAAGNHIQTAGMNDSEHLVA